MSVDQNKDVVRRVVDALNRHDYAVIDELFAPDVLAHHPYGPPMHGLASLKEYMVMIRTSFPDFRITILEMIAEGDQVASKYTATGTQQGEFGGMPATGKSINVVAVNVLRFADGRIVDDWEIWDQFGMMQQLGLIPVVSSPPPQ